jgi:hypothetical protein
MQTSFNSSLGWIYIGNALRICQILGMHRDVFSQETTAYEREIRRYLWWTVYESERNVSLTSGKPFGINNKEVNTPFPDESILSPGPFHPQGSFSEYVKLAQITGDICEAMYSAPRTYENVKLATIPHYYERLKTWHESLPPHLILDLQEPSSMHTRNVAILSLRYHCSVLLVSRPMLYQYVKEKREPGMSVTKIPTAFVRMYSDICFQAARESLYVLEYLLNNGLLCSLFWPDMYHALSVPIVLALDHLGRNELVTGRLVQQSVKVILTLNPRSGFAAYARYTLRSVLTRLGLDADLATEEQDPESRHGPMPLIPPGSQNKLDFVQPVGVPPEYENLEMLFGFDWMDGLLN